MERAEKPEEVDQKKLGEDFAYLVDNGKYAEMVILANQLESFNKIPKKDIINALDKVEAVLGQKHKELDGVLEEKKGLGRLVGTPSNQETKRFLQILPVSFVVGASTMTGGMGFVAGLGGALLASKIVGAVEDPLTKKNLEEKIQKIRDAKEALEPGAGQE